MNDPVSDPAHAVTENVALTPAAVAPPPEPPRPAPEPRITELMTLLNNMLRMQAIIVPVRHHEQGEAHTGPDKSGHRQARRARREKPVEEWVVSIFSGGMVQLPKGTDGEAYVQGVNMAVQQAVKPYLDQAIATVIELLGVEAATPTAALEQGKKAEAALEQVSALKRFGVTYFPSDQWGTSYCTRGGVDARFRDLARATAIVEAMNKVLLSAASPHVARVRALIIERLKALN